MKTIFGTAVWEKWQNPFFHWKMEVVKVNGVTTSKIVALKPSHTVVKKKKYFKLPPFFLIILICQCNIVGKLNSFVYFAWHMKSALNVLWDIKCFSLFVQCGGWKRKLFHTCVLFKSSQGFSISAKLALNCISKKSDGFCTCFYFSNPEVSSIMGILSNQLHFNIPVRSMQFPSL